LVAQIGLHPAHPSLSLPAELARHLGVRRLDASLAVELLAELSSGWSDAGDVDTRWLGTVLKELRRDPQLSNSLASLRKLRVLPLADGRLESAAGGAPLHLLGALLAGELLPRDRELSVFASLRLLHPDLLEAAAADSDVLSVLSLLRVETLTHDALVLSHLIPALASSATPPAELPALLCLVHRLHPRCRSLGSEGQLRRRLVAARARLLAADGSVVAVSDDPCRLHVCSAICTPDFLPDPPPRLWRTVDAAYAADGARHAEMRGLLSELGVGAFPSILRVGGDRAPLVSLRSCVCV